MRVETEALSGPRPASPTVDDAVDVVTHHLDALALSPRRVRNELRPYWTRFSKPKGWLPGEPRVGLVHDEAMLLHQLPGHVERPGRISVPYRRLQREGTLSRCFQLLGRAATRMELQLFHTKDHVADVSEGNVELSEDLYWQPDVSFKSAVVAAGSTLQAVEAVLHGALDSAFALVRPPGHHAEPTCSQGFCLFNNVALAAHKALASPDLCQRLVILDWDAHHGNGTQTGFYQTANVLYISLHRGGAFYPGTGDVTETGEGDGYGFTVNIPWPGGGFGDPDYLAAFECVVEPMLTAFGPDLILVSAGFDAARHDPLGGLDVTPDCFAHLTKRLMDIQSKTVLVLEGGYNLLQLAACVDCCVRTLLGETPKPLKRGMQMQPETEDVLKAVAKNLSLVWPVLRDEECEMRMHAFKENVLKV